MEPRFDVYARSYVPSALRTVNQEPVNETLVTEAKHRIDYQAYVKAFTGSDFLVHQGTWDHEVSADGQSPTAELTVQSYVSLFAGLLQRECAAKEKQNEQFALYQVPLQMIAGPHIPRLWALSVPGLREDKPLIEMGDTLNIRQLWVDRSSKLIQMPTMFSGESGPYVAYKPWTGLQYNACVYSVSRVNETVYLKVDGLEILAQYNVLPMVVNVVFPLQQRTLKAQRSALLSVSRSSKPLDLSSTVRDDWIRKTLFPVEGHGRLQTALRNIPHRALFDHAINYEQAHAVNSVCAFDYGITPYIISGPPGSGKTKTLVEIAMQLLNTTTVAHLLICAPSEAAADTLALRLKCYLTPKQLLRLNAPNRADNEVSPGLLQYCFSRNNMFYLPPFKSLMSFSVVVTSNRDVAMLAEARLTNADLWTMERDMVSALHPGEKPSIPTLHWGALLLDEAAQATEIDVLPAISVINPPSDYPHDQLQPRLVMAGDEHQLGPRTASQDPAFSTSLFARLFSRSLYVDHPLSRSKVKPSSGPPVLKRSMLPILYPSFTNLVRNYRSHPAILSVSSSVFYHDTLIPEAAFPHTPLQSSSLWRGRKWPVLYLPHTGSDEIERENGGWYNQSEAKLACSIAQDLVLESGVKQEDICIMSPFAAQVKLLRKQIRSSKYAGGSGLWDVNIGPVEAFQGLEKRVVIICTTRTRQRFVEEDVKWGMGLVHQQRKMNVALTRAKEALVVIGSPEVLGADEHWRAWMSFCERNGLVNDQLEVWENREQFKDGKVGVLERALIAKEDGMRDDLSPALGAAAADYDIDGGEYEAWTESLRKALDGEDDEVDEEGCDEESDTSTPGTIGDPCNK
ncbi:P-loop containing nucleoside triphosphate hydrolase protein [Boeremia exigua]|uniref:P-loop containing nucleoside triphosphate hydrolase protein n=1 Tax=Boeremia exigua TaxID=749465 RepID=UPI001E8DDAD1|nr:P-loop containing nucleoside triphosphate hydrolase protein [Boeremia exigua]KAH6633207.1 P-loop containing nucleoside triphosphate hydrolase protein [Boeremia exigua]